MTTPNSSPCSTTYSAAHHITKWSALWASAGPDCPICRDEIRPEWTVFFIDCGHRFDWQCIEAWGKALIRVGEPLSCPMCRCAGSKIAAAGKKAQFLFDLVCKVLHGAVDCNDHVALDVEQDLAGCV